MMPRENKRKAVQVQEHLFKVFLAAAGTWFPQHLRSYGHSKCLLSQLKSTFPDMGTRNGKCDWINMEMLT